MTNVSKKPLKNEVESQLFRQLAKMFAQADERKTNLLFMELFTPTEKLMFVKRLAIIFMLHKEQSTYRIAQLLKVSDATVRRIATAYDAGQYDTMVGMTKKSSFDSERFWKTIEVILRGGMPAYGKDRWKGFGLHD